jgi:hypothetical protein
VTGGCGDCLGFVDGSEIILQSRIEQEISAIVKAKGE